MKIAITGASGSLGNAIIKAVIAVKDTSQVIGIARDPSTVQDLGIETRGADYQDGASYERALEGGDTLLLISGMDAPEKRIEQHRNVIRAAQKNGVKKVVYTSVQGAEEGTAFSPIIQSNRQTEQDVRNSGLDWVIGRNGIYIEPDVDYIDTYTKLGSIANCAGDGKCGYTTRPELAYAYAKMLTDAQHNGQTYHLHGEAITQYQLAEYLNGAFDTDLSYTPMSVESCRQDRVAELGEFIGTVIAGIYQGIRQGKADNPSQFYQAAGREHQSWPQYFENLTPQPTQYTKRQ